MANFSPLTESECGELGECLSKSMLDRVLDMQDKLLAAMEILRKADHTLVAHGRIDANTPLHELIEEAY